MPGFRLRKVQSWEDVEHNFRTIWWLLTGRADSANIAAAGEASSVDWANVTNKPSEFVPTTHGNEKHSPTFMPYSGGIFTGEVDMGSTYLKIGAVSSLPTASSAYRGKIIRVEGGAGVADAVYVCVKDATDTYVWYQIY